MINFDTRTMSIDGKKLIENGKAVNGYTIPSNPVTFTDIEQLYGTYESSFPDVQYPSSFYAKPKKELKLSDLVYGKDRSDAQQQLERTLLEGIINRTLIYPDETKWFWQSEKYEMLVIPRWFFTQECHRHIAYKNEKNAKNELWDRNIVGRRLRLSLNENRKTNYSENMTIKDCLMTIREEIEEKNTHRFFTDGIVNSLLTQYMTDIPVKQKKAEIGQNIARIRKAKTALTRLKEIDAFLDKNICTDVYCRSKTWYTAYHRFADYCTLSFIKQFIPGTTVDLVQTDIYDYTERCIKTNKDKICQYIMAH